jgi:hypothetical protein
MNYTETFDQFASKLSTTDLALYAGAGLILWVLFKDKMSPVQNFLSTTIEKIKSSPPLKSVNPVSVVVPTVKPVVITKEDIFFKLVASWKQTRDLAVESGCDDAVKAADQMFPYLSPNVCGNSTTPINNSILKTENKKTVGDL